MLLDEEVVVIDACDLRCDDSVGFGFELVFPGHRASIVERQPWSPVRSVDLVGQTWPRSPASSRWAVEFRSHAEVGFR